MQRVFVSVAAFAAAAMATMVGYKVEPKTALWSGKATGDPQYGGVGQYVVCTWDSLSFPGRVELFTGDLGGEGAHGV